MQNKPHTQHSNVEKISTQTDVVRAENGLFACPLYKVISPTELEQCFNSDIDHLIYYEAPPTQQSIHFGGVLNSCYPFDVTSLTTCNKGFILQGDLNLDCEILIWSHTPGSPPQKLTSIKSEAGNFQCIIPQFNAVSGQRLTAEFLSNSNTTPEFLGENIGWHALSKQEPKETYTAIICCFYNTPDLLLSNIGRLTSSTLWENLNAELIVVNNNGQSSTLNLDYPKVTQFKQDNLGGSGGFLRGIDEAFYKSLSDKNFTHAILMDDDVIFHPEIIRRACQFQAFSLNEIAIGASMLKLEKPGDMHEAGGMFRSPQELGSYTEVPKGKVTHKTLEFLGRAKPVHYNAWWFCCFSKIAVERAGLPLQLFIHGDDIEYGIRLGKNNIPSYSIGGLSIWHSSFENKHLSWTYYFNFRNAIIRLLSQQPEPKHNLCIAKKSLEKVVRRALIRNDYGQAAMALRAYDDITKTRSDFHIDCYTSKIKKLTEEYRNTQGSLTHCSTKLPTIKINNQPKTGTIHKCSTWIKKITTNGVTLPLPSIKLFVADSTRYQWSNVPAFSDILIELGDEKFYYKKDTKKARSILTRLKQTKELSEYGTIQSYLEKIKNTRGLKSTQDERK